MVKALAVLNTDQRTQWQRLTGKPFEGKAGFPGFGFPGFGLPAFTPPGGPRRPGGPGKPGPALKNDKACEKDGKKTNEPGGPRPLSNES
jgi:hypothetical protein